MMIEYLVITYITHARHFVKCFINRILHFETTMTSRDEDEHAVLKRQLESSTKDLKIVVNEINLLLINEHHNYELALADQKVRYSTALRKSIFSQLTAHITHYALRKIVTQYALLTDQFTMLDSCSKTFIIIIELLCSHKIQKRLFNKKNILLKDVYSH